MVKVSINFSTGNYSDAELSVKTSDVLLGMKDNPSFLTPIPALAEVEEALAAFNSSLSAANSGSHQAVAVKNESRKTLEGLMHDLAIYVNLTAKGDEAILLSSGFDLTKQAEAAGPLQAPVNVQVHPGQSKGSVEVSCNRVEHASSYTVEYRNLTNGNGNGAATAFATKPKVLINGLTSGNQYAFRVLAVGSNPQRNWSDEVNSYVL